MKDDKMPDKISKKYTKRMKFVHNYLFLNKIRKFLI